MRNMQTNSEGRADGMDAFFFFLISSRDSDGFGLGIGEGDWSERDGVVILLRNNCVRSRQAERQLFSWHDVFDFLTFQCSFSFVNNCRCGWGCVG